jgi:CrcB protein
MLKNILLVGFGGFIGSVARYLLSKINGYVNVFSIPIGTLSINIIGSIIIGFLTGISIKSPFLTLELRLLLMVGICGGFTTFSTFTNENLILFQNGQYLSIILYTVLSIVLGFGSVYLGYISANLF